MIMDNKPFLFEGRGREAFTLAFKLACLGTNAIPFWGISAEHGAVLFWAKPTEDLKYKVMENPFGSRPDQVEPLIWGWLEGFDMADCRIPEPDIDGDTVKGFRFERDYWGNAGGSRYAFISIAPVWALIGK